jgi:hypothetical protein
MSTIYIGGLVHDFPFIKDYLEKEILEKFPNTTDEDKVKYEYLSTILQTIKNLDSSNAGEK